MAKVAQLRVLFPQFDAEVLEGILHAKKDSIDDAIEALLSMDTEEHSPSDFDIIPGVDSSDRAAARRNARKRQRQRKRKNGNNGKKVKWVRFSPFVTAIKKEPLKADHGCVQDNNPFRPLADEGVKDSWEELVEDSPKEEVEKEKEVNLEDVAPSQQGVFNFDFDDFPPLPEKGEEVEVKDFDALEPAVPAILKEDSPLDDLSEKQEPPLECSIEADFCHVSPLTLSALIEPCARVAVKIYFSDTDIRRLSLDKKDPQAFEKLRTSIVGMTVGDFSAPFAPTYVDEEEERITIRSQEELEECIRVHEECIWNREGQPAPAVPILRLSI